MSTLVLIRHGQSLWNKNNLFTGWVDVPLSRQGIDEALAAGEKLKAFKFDAIYVSTLARAMQTALIAMAENDSNMIPVIQPGPEMGERQGWAKIYSEETLKNSIPVFKAWQLNERYYGELQGLDKQKTRDKYGEEQVHIWRRSYDVPPPNGEALKNTAERTIPYFEKEIVEQLKGGKNLLVSAHGNSLRSIVMFIEKLSEEQVLSLEIKTGDPIQYTFDNGVFKKIEF